MTEIKPVYPDRLEIAKSEYHGMVQVHVEEPQGMFKNNLTGSSRRRLGP